MSPYSYPGIAGPTPTLRAKYPLKRVKDAVCEAFAISHDQLKAKSRITHHVIARQTLCWLARRYSNATLGDIGLIILRDHSTVMHSVTSAAQVFAQDYKGYRATIRLAESHLIN